MLSEELVQPTPAAMLAQAAMVVRAEIELTALMTGAIQEKALEGCREEERGLGSHLHSHCLSKVRAHTLLSGFSGPFSKYCQVVMPKSAMKTWVAETEIMVTLNSREAMAMYEAGTATLLA